MGEQKQWHFCQQCSVMFFGGKNRDAGFCVEPFTDDDNRHIAQGFEFTVTFVNADEEPNTQMNWFFCRKCFGLFFVATGGDPGTCARDGGGHDSTGSLNFHLPHDIPVTQGNQRDWRFCHKCSLLYFGGNPGHCVKGGSHEQINSFDFVLPLGGEFIPKQFTL